MKYYCFFIILLGLSVAACFAETGNRQTRYVKIKNVSPEKLATLLADDIDIHNVRNNNEVYAHVSADQFDRLTDQGFQLETLPDRSKQYADSLWAATQYSENPLAAYHTYNELTVELQQLAQQYPAICWLESIGQSVLGRALWMMKISDHVAVEEYEPEFKYISSMHGDEPVGMEMCLSLIHHLLENYGIDSRITRIVGETEIWIMPLMNPDGYVLRQRRNYHGVDLNRNFPDRFRDPNDTPIGREPETQAVMNFSRAHSFVLSANFHTGALVFNYPYDSNSSGQSVYTACPDDSLFIALAHTYASHNRPMWNSTQFHHGITNGADWYVIYGGMQDWNYVWRGCNEVTIELSDEFWPNADLLPGFWEDNREAMLSYLEAVHWGVRGIISDAVTEQPLFATIAVAGIDHQVYSDPELGDYYRMLLPGKYQIHFSAEGYRPQVYDSVLVMPDYVTYLDVKLIPENSLIVQGTVRDRLTGAPLSADLIFEGRLKFQAATDSGTGAFQVSVPADTYRIAIRNDRYVVLRDTLVVTADLNLAYELLPYRFVLDLDFEADAGNLVSSDSLWQWGIPAYGPRQAHSGQNLWGTMLQGSYPNGADAKLLSPDVTLPEVDGLLLSCWYWMEAEVDDVLPDSAYDGGLLELSDDNGWSWTQIFPPSGYSHAISSFAQSSPFQAGTPVFSGQFDWSEAIFDLNDYRGRTIQFRFNFGSDADNDSPYAGWYIDDVAIKYPYAPTGVDYQAACLMAEHFWLSPNFPNPFNNNTTLNYRLPQTIKIRISIFNIKGQVTKVLIDAEQLAGNYRISWEGDDDEGRPVSSGVYLIQMTYGTEMFTRKALLLR